MGGCLSAKSEPTSGQRTESKSKKAGQLSEQQLRVAIDRLFEEYDKDSSGALEKHEVAHLMRKSLGRTDLSEKQVEQFISKMDSDGSKTLDKNELFRIYKQLYC